MYILVPEGLEPKFVTCVRAARLTIPAAAEKGARARRLEASVENFMVQGRSRISDRITVDLEGRGSGEVREVARSRGFYTCS